MTILAGAVFFLAQACQVKIRNPAGTNTSAPVGTSEFRLVPDANSAGGTVNRLSTTNYDLHSASAGSPYLNVKAQSSHFMLVGGISVGE